MQKYHQHIFHKRLFWGLWDLNKQQVLEILSIATKKLCFASWTLLQPDWWSSQGLSLCVNFSKRFSMSLQTKWLKNYQKTFKPIYYERYADDFFVLFKKPEQVILLVNSLSKTHKNINFLFKTGKENFSFFFLMLRFV